MNDAVHGSLEIDGLPVRWISDAGEFRDLVSLWRSSAVIALDTEFVRERTYFPAAGLLQVCDRKGCYLVDPVQISNLSPIVDLFEDEAVVKLMHSCSEDLELFGHLLGTIPRPLFDTQVAAAFAGFGISIGYQRLVDALLGVNLDKSQTRTDWCRRPLSTAQLRYAAEDVAYLPRVYDALSEMLREAGKLGWAKEECESLMKRRQNADQRKQVREISGTWRLNRRQLFLLGLLHAWREQVASKRDLPRNWIINNQALMEIAQAMPRRRAELASIEALSARTRGQYAEQILALSEQACNCPESELPEPVEPPLPPAISRKLRQVRQMLRCQADRNGIAPELLMRKQEVEDLFRKMQNRGQGQGFESPLFNGWRQQLIGASVKTALERICH